MGRWSHLDSDEERLPAGMTRIGYDSTDQSYRFRDSDGSIWTSAPGCRYGRLTKVSNGSGSNGGSRPAERPARASTIAGGGSSSSRRNGSGKSISPSPTPTRSATFSVGDGGATSRSRWMTAEEERRMDEQVAAFLGPPPAYSPRNTSATAAAHATAGTGSGGETTHRGQAQPPQRRSSWLQDVMKRLSEVPTPTPPPATYGRRSVSGSVAGCSNRDRICGGLSRSSTVREVGEPLQRSSTLRESREVLSGRQIQSPRD